MAFRADLGYTIEPIKVGTDILPIKTAIVTWEIPETDDRRVNVILGEYRGMTFIISNTFAKDAILILEKWTK